MTQSHQQQYITGIQQIGIGVKDLQVSKMWYKQFLGMEVQVFDDQADAPLMTQYTGGKVQSRQALLSMNIAGGGGMEVWQYVSREPQAAKEVPLMGDLGIFAGKMKSQDVAASYQYHKAAGLKISELFTNPKGENYYWLQDPQGNWFNVVKGNEWFRKPDGEKHMGGVYGAVIGVSNIDNAMKLYKDVLCVNEIVYDVTGPFEDMPQKDTHQYRRVLLRKKGSGIGAFSQLIGGIEIELVQVLDRVPKKIYADRFWGDLGFIHLCFDVIDMNHLKQVASKAGFAFTVDSADSFSMGQAAGRFAYLEDPDQTLIELVETHKVPIVKKIGWYLDLKKRGVDKPLPNWMIGCMAFSKVK